ncbi:phosphotransferase [Glaciibacter psychrotolerans]|uniref:Aminoglycoside phosphotransferase (APT) family kinase protein n=1 Tax=Glaciibacter psychrotolerans TaxID=670054 RepID=A0A7Z0EEZ2_9MICO|nr:phosphotransferase [Leifsonia psychrotolerans]NYJ19712.1 aminoglycoside phosphotransferase (APT) family kinase protein [Leifsonia psychrotolerans]
MARSHLTLAALATSALPGLDVAQARMHSQRSHGLFDSALIIDRDGRELIIRVPRSQSAETEQSADLVALRALTVGNRSRLPFDIPEFLGQTPTGPTRAIVYELLPGDSFETDALTGHVGVSGSIGRAIAAIHGLPTAFIADAGLSQQTAHECRTATIALIDRAASTGYLPAALLRRWEQATDDDALWQFAPTVVHGSLSDESFLIVDDAVSGVLGWAALAVGDPARDLNWLLAARGEAAETAISSYLAARQGGDPRLTQRAMLYAELELARWLLHGSDTRNQEIVDDAVAMLDGLVDTVHSNTSDSLSTDTGVVLDVDDVETLLDATPRDAASRGATPHGSAMHTDSFDRAELAAMFGSESDDAPSSDSADGSDGDVYPASNPFADPDEPVERVTPVMPAASDEPFDPNATAAYSIEAERARESATSTDDQAATRSSAE